MAVEVYAICVSIYYMLFTGVIAVTPTMHDGGNFGFESKTRFCHRRFRVNFF